MTDEMIKMTETTVAFDDVAYFSFDDVTFDDSNSLLRLGYSFRDERSHELCSFEECIRFPGVSLTLSAQTHNALQHVFRWLHWVAGVSYFKAAVPPNMMFHDTSPNPMEASVFNEAYRLGLGEFLHQNQLSLAEHSLFGAGEAWSDAPVASVKPRKALTAIGGGKDSLVSIEALREFGVDQTLVYVGKSPLIEACCEHTGLPWQRIERQLSPQLFALNRQGAYNGHIPVTLINSLILIAHALLTGHDAVVFSNERSASYGSLIEGSGEVNHQWSKGFDCERMVASLLHQAKVPVTYFSQLRPWAELAVASQFAKLDRYDQVFSSCNRNFHILGDKPEQRWCQQCPKCLFVFLALAPFVAKPRLVGIFGKNLLDDESLIAGYEALLEFGASKPFECVGEGQESRAAMLALSQRADWAEDVMVLHFSKHILPNIQTESLVLDDWLQPSDEHRVPEELCSKH